MAVAEHLVFTNDVARNQTIQEHLIGTHSKSVDEVAKLTTDECWECHEQLHAKVLGSFWLAGK